MRKIKIPTLHPNQEIVVNSTKRHRVVACGRRFGKTTLGIYDILRAAAIRRQTCWWIAPTYGMTDHVWRELKAACADTDQVAIHQDMQRLDFPGGGSITLHSAHTPDHLRGAGLDFVVLDEAAFLAPEVWPQVVRPMLLERKGRALFLSSPNGKNWFWEIYQNGVQNRRTWRSFHYTSYDNPLIDPAELDLFRHQTTERIWSTEYLAEFSDHRGQVFRGIHEAAIVPFQAGPITGIRYVAGIDWGRDNDATAIVLIDADRQQVVALDHFTGVSWALQRGRVMKFYDHWGPSLILAESNSIGSPNIEALRDEGLPIRPFVTSAASKSPLIDALALAIERRDLTLLPDETLLGELAAYTAERLPGGGWRYNAAPGQHDDLVIALALAWHAARTGGPSIDFA